MDRATPAEAARQLGLHRSTVTRHLKQHPSLLDDDGKVDVQELRDHRDQVLNPKLQTRGPGSGAAPTFDDESAKYPSGLASGARKSQDPSLNDSRGRAEAAKADNAELDLAERMGLTLRRADVEDAIAAAADVMQQTAAALARDRAEHLAIINDARAMERALDDLFRELLTQGGRALSLAAAKTGTDRAA